MRKKFVGKKRFPIRYIIYLVVIYIVYQLTVGIFLNFRLPKTNEEFILFALRNSNSHWLYQKANQNILTKVINFLNNFDINKPTTLLKTNLVYYENNDYHVSDPNPIVASNPRIYVINTHQQEGYADADLSNYGITPNVMMASYMLKENLNKAGIETLVEDANFEQMAILNNWDRSNPYGISRHFLEDTLMKYPKLDLIIDLHRDSIKHDPGTVEINGKKYAKVLFVVGQGYENFEPNLNLATTINSLVEKKYPTLTRGIYKTNYVYNQNASSKMILLEVGGYENTIEEVMNTLDVITEVLKEHLS